ncbi:MAG: hypothetical protein JNM00_04430, partial [Flavobacteriales bacterium]|nr:hypothetical protein [Flavobacteriales bacterium]
MNKSFLFLLSLAAPIMAGAQLNHGGEPLQWADSHFSLELPFITTPELDKQLIAAQDAISDPIKDAPWRFGIEVPCEATPENAGQWTFFPEENLAVWHLGIECPGATGVSLEFEKFRIPKGGKMYLWDASRTVYRGALTHLNNKDHGGMTVGLISSDRIVIEYQIAMDAEDWGDLKLKSIIHAYRGLQSKLNELQAEQDRGPFGNSGACNINVNCPEGDAW